MSGHLVPGCSSLGLQPPAVDFVENRGPEYHPAFDNPNAEYDPSVAQFVPRPPSSAPHTSSHLMAPHLQTPPPRPVPPPVDEMDAWIEIFPRAMTQLREDPEPWCDPRWGIRHLSEWRAVREVLNEARKEYEFSEEERLGRCRRKARSFLDKCNVPMKQAIGLVNTDMTAPVVGVLNILLDKAYNQASEVRDKVYNGFENLPASFQRMNTYLQNYPGDDNITNASVSLVLATFKAIESAIAFYTSNQAKRAGLAVFTGPEYQQKLLQNLKSVESSGSALDTAANLALAHHTLVSAEMIRQDNLDTRRAVDTASEEARLDRWRSTRLLNTLMNVMHERQLEWQFFFQSSPVPPRAHTPQPVEPQYLTPEALWIRLGRIPHFDEQDMDHIKGNEALLFPEDRGLAENIIETRKFRIWINSPGSTKLLVHGDFDTVQDISPYSIICFTVTWLFRKWMTRGIRGTISLVFFCGRHVAWHDYRGGRAMILSLINQLLRQFPLPAIQPCFEINRKTLSRCTVDDLCELFQSFMRQLPHATTVVCLIDGINLYERDQYLDDMERVVLCLLELVGDGNGELGAKLKLLLTSPQPTLEVRRFFDGEQDTLIHAADLPSIQQGVSLEGFEERLGWGSSG